MSYRFAQITSSNPPALDEWYPYGFVTVGAQWRTCLDLFHEAERWCFDQFGTEPERWMSDLAGRILFRDQSDATAFKVRWC